MGRTNPKIPYIWLRKKDIGEEKQNNNEGSIEKLFSFNENLQRSIS